MEFNEDDVNSGLVLVSFLQQNHRLDNKEKITWKLAILTLCVFFLITPLEEHVKIDVTQHEKKDSLHSL